MPLSVAVIIPTLNEESRIERAIRSAFACGACEVIVADGGSTDRTRQLASVAGATVINSARRLRASQLNEGARASTADVLLFLHADTELPTDAREYIAMAIAQGHECGGFRLRFDEPSARLKVAAQLINFRSNLTRCPWGDQAQFARRSTFERLGGFRELEIMEDYDFARRARSQFSPTVLNAYVTTSGRRFLERGLLRTTFTNWRIIAAFHLGEDTSSLAQRYRGD